MKYRHTIWLTAFAYIILTPVFLNAQPNISSVINDYTEVTGLDICSNSVTVSSTSNFSVGDRVLLIQMKGASIDQSNSSSFGTVTSYNEAGNYEFATIQSISGNQIVFQNYLVRNYNPSASVQLVRVPQYNNVTLSGTVTAQPWNGNTGGIVVFAATGTVNVSGNAIDVSGQGFRGGNVVNVGGPCSSTDYYYDCNSANGANKGESIVDLSCTYQRGRGAGAGGAGGGNGHNNGGAGGGNGATGGQGGCYSSCCNPGIGGYDLNYSNSANKTFLGSGGGAGHANDNANVSGADGGGIVMITANTIDGGNGTIQANGADANSTSVNDGVGGGGAGGTVMITANSYSSSVNVQTNGGDGGSCSDSSPHGTGGGGSGGVLWVGSTSVPAQINYSSNGGANGTHLGDSRNAASGQQGIDVTDLQIPAGTTPFSPLSLSTTKNDMTCNGANDGWVNADVSGGLSPYTYNWSNNASTDSITNLGTGSYTVTVSDDNNCTVTATETINEPSAIQLSTTIQNVSCSGNSDGSIDLTVSGGTPPYQYNWSNNYSSQDLNGVEAGSYTVTVTDDNGCTATTTATIQEPQAITASATTQDVSCFNGSDGIIELTTSGGTTPYDYSWSHGPTGDSIGGLSSGSYIVNISDSNNCSINKTITINQPPEIVVEVDQTNPTCRGYADGNIDLSVNGGTGSYDYNWANGSTTQDLDSLSAGTYSVTVDDDNNCQDSLSVTLNEPDSMDVGSNTSSVTCYGGEDGRISLSTTGGTPPYDYNWANGDSNPTQQNVTAGSYTVTITDDEGCSKSNSYTLTQPSQLTVDVQDTFLLEFGQTKEIEAFASEDNVTFLWSPKDSLSCVDCQSPITSAVRNRTYNVQVTNEDGCSAEDSTKIFVGPKRLFIPNAFTPNGDGRNDEFRVFVKGVKEFRLKVFNRWGEKLFETRDIDEGWDGTNNGTPLPTDVYTYHVHIKYLDNSKVTNKSGTVTLIR